MILPVVSARNIEDNPILHKYHASMKQNTFTMIDVNQFIRCLATNIKNYNNP